MQSEQPIGIFDAGVGGLSIARSIRALLPAEEVLYVADSRHAPYGDKPYEFIVARSMALTAYLVEQGAKAVVVACNTVTLATIRALRERFEVPIVGVEPGVKPAVRASRSGVIGVLATVSTVASPGIRSLIGRFSAGKRVLLQPCPGLADQVERLALDTPQTRALVARYLEALTEAGVDTLVLGCTHYPFLMPLIRERVGPDVDIIETGEAVAREVRRRLACDGLLRDDESGSAPGSRLLTSATEAGTQRVLAALWPYPAAISVLPVLPAVPARA